MRRSRRLSFFALLFLLALSAGAAAAPRVRDVRLADHGGGWRCVVELDGPATFRYRNASADENTISIEITGISGAPIAVRDQSSTAFFRDSVLNFYSDRDTLYIHLHTAKEVNVETQRLQNPERLIFDLYTGPRAPAASIESSTVRAPGARTSSDQAKPASSASPRVAPAAAKSSKPAPVSSAPHAERPRIVIIDPGHGGRHRGGFGYVKGTRGQQGVVALPSAFKRDYPFDYGRKIEEANATLPIGLKLEKLLAADPRFQPQVTRRSDDYVGLRERTRRAEQYHGEYFVSIHYNSVPESSSKTPRGLEIYTWTPRETDSVGTRAIQQLENEEGVGSSLSNADASTREVLGQMMVDALAEQALESRQAAKAIEGAVKRDDYFARYYRGIKSARLKVLENYNMPSTLVEVGFICNPTEASLAADPAFQERMARVLYEGIVAYFEANDPGFRTMSSKQVARR